jgi:hypothetical protein
MTISRRTFGLTLMSAGLGTACSLPSPTARSAAPGTTSPPANASPTSSRGDTPSPALRLDPQAGQRISVDLGNGRSLAVRAWTGLPTVARPLEADYQQLNLYIPEAYLRGERIGRHTARSAPIFLPNQVGGYMPAKPGTPDAQRMAPPATAPAASATAQRASATPAGVASGPAGASHGAPSSGPSTIAQALARGYVVAAPGARGRTLRTADGRWSGKAPAAIVDLKAAVRWLHHNADRLPAGDVERIVSNGTSAGGALSALLGASGNGADYTAELDALGAAPGRDDIWAVSAYCPITALGLADGAHEWQFNAVHDDRRIEMSMLDDRMQRTEVPGTLTPLQIALSDALKAGFPAQINALGLTDATGRALRLEADGRGSLRDHVQGLLVASAQDALDRGQALGERGWLQLQGGRVVAADFDAYARAVGRMKTVPAFDGVALDTGENQLFGDATTDRRHFTDFSLAHSQGDAAGTAGRAPDLTVRQMDALRQLADGRNRVAPHWRIRHGTADRDTGLAVPALLAAAVRPRARSVDLALPWDRPHSGDYDLPALFDWIDERLDARLDARTG